MNAPFDAMWIWWVPTVGLCAWKLIEGLLQPMRMLEWPFLACAMWLYFYGYMAFNAKMALSAYLGNDVSNIGQLVALLCLIGLLVGWQLGRREKIRPSQPSRHYPHELLWWEGASFITIGAIGGYIVQRSASEGLMDFQHVSAYWYLIFYVGYPGMMLVVWSLLRLKGRPQFWRVLGSLVLMAGFMYPHLASARRGPLLPAVLILLLVPPLTSRRPPNRMLFLGGLAGAGLIMLLFLQVRVVTYNGGTWADAIQHLNLAETAERGKDAEDNEYVNSCQVIGTVYENSTYEFGTGHLSLLLHWIPRAVWPDKPVLGDGIYTSDELFDQVEAATGFRLLGSGASAGGVADSFLQYGLLCPLFWFAFSWGLARIYSRALGGRPFWLFAYVAICCASHWLISQSFSAAFVPCAYFLVIPLLTFGWLDRLPQPRLRARRSAIVTPQRELEKVLP